LLNSSVPLLRGQASHQVNTSAMRVLAVVVSTASAVVASAVEYCPKADDFTVAYSPENIVIMDRGWSNSGGGGVATKATFNLNGGYVEFDADFRDVRPGVNANLYTVAPTVHGEFYDHSTDYCDGQGENGTEAFCNEMDFIESNGNCAGASTWHTVPGPGMDGCTAWGCHKEFNYTWTSVFHMRIEYDADGAPKVFRNGVELTDFTPAPRAEDLAIVKKAHEEKGAVIVSTMWVGWVPIEECGSSGNATDLQASTMNIWNLKISGAVVQGPTPTECHHKFLSV